MTSSIRKIILFIIISITIALVYNWTSIDREYINEIHRQMDSVYYSKRKNFKKKTVSTFKVSLNLASKSELTSLKGIGPKMAERIIAYRLKKAFTSIEEVQLVRGIGPKKFEAIKMRLVL